MIISSHSGQAFQGFTSFRCSASLHTSLRSPFQSFALWAFLPQTAMPLRLWRDGIARFGAASNNQTLTKKYFFNHSFFSKSFLLLTKQTSRVLKPARFFKLKPNHARHLFFFKKYYG
jgi:hypothetical protein